MDSKETAIYFYLIIASTFLALILLFFLISIIKQQRKYRELNTAKVNAEINTLESERKRMARDLHDELGPVLSAAKNLLQSIDSLPESDAGIQQEAITFIDKSITKMRQIARSIMPQSLASKGLIFAIQEFINSTGNHGIAFQLTHKDIAALPEITSLQVYHVIQEIVHNTIKHSGATQCRIHLSVSEKNLILQTADNGCGYNQVEVKESNRGLGIAIMESRITMLKGQLNVLSEKQKGTHYYITIPLP